MHETGQKWFAKLNAAVTHLREANPLPSREQFDDADEWRCRIVGSSLLHWLEDIGPTFLQERSVLCTALEIEPDPFVVFTSDTPGLVAAQEILGTDNEKITFLSGREFEAWLYGSPDESYRWHTHVFSQFRDTLESEFQQSAKEQYPVPIGVAYWQHSEGTNWAALAGKGVDHLWKWDGEKPELLEEAFTHWVR